MNINEEKRNQWQALKGMGFKAHWDYFWDYYKIHVIVGIIVIAVTISLIKDIVSQKPFALSCTFVNTASMNDPTPITDGFAEFEHIDTSKYTISIDASSTIDMDNPDQYTVANAERIYAMIAARDLDIIVADEKIFRNYVGNEMYQDLSTFFTTEELTSLGDKLVYVDKESLIKEQDPVAEASATPKTVTLITNPDETEKQNLIPIGIRLENNHHFNDLEYYPGQPAYIGIVTATERTDTAADFIRYLLN